MLILLSFAILCAELLATPSEWTAWHLLTSQILLLADQLRTKQVSGVGGFVFMSVLFFGIRPIYLIRERDYGLLIHLFRTQSDIETIAQSMWWATFALIGFCTGAKFANRHLQQRLRFSRPRQASAPTTQSAKAASWLIAVQVISIPPMLLLSDIGRGLYGSGFGAYAYDLPVPLQSCHIISLVVSLERFLKGRTTENLTQLCIAGILFLYFTWLMREVSMFRGFYVAGVMIAGIAVLSSLKPRVGLAWLIVPVVVAQPLFRALGEHRYLSNSEIGQSSIISLSFNNSSIAAAYWDFYDADGDINIFDTFVAARAADVSNHPYLTSWLYVPFHLVPRAVWESKPKNGVLEDFSFTNGAPYCPGIAGIFFLDGGDLWMIGCMLVLGYLISWLDMRVLTLPGGFLRSCLIGIVSVNAMFLSRFFLWQFFYQLLYAAIPCIAFHYFVHRMKSRSPQLEPSAEAALQGPAIEPAHPPSRR